jgi:hypothetical protein
MDRTQILIALLGSAAIGALVSSVITVFAQWRERKSRREELLLTKAIEMAHVRFANVMTVLKDTQQGGMLEPDLLMLKDYHKSLRYLMKHNELDPPTKERIAAEMKRHGLKL